MKKQLRVMDSTGDSAITFDPAEADAKATQEAQHLFDRMSKKGAVFAINRKDGIDKRVKSFDELEEDNLCVPAIVGG